MANQTITADANLTDLVSAGLANGEDITIDGGARLTVNSSPTVLIGQININDGELLLDGANATTPIVFVGEQAEEINVNGAGLLKSTLGWWDHPTVSTGAANQTWDIANYFSGSLITADIFSGCWVETGRRINYTSGSGVAPKIGDWIYKVSDQNVHGRIEAVSGTASSGYVVVTFLTGVVADTDAIEIHSLQQKRGPDYQISWTATASGADVLEAGVFQEFANVYQNSTDFLSQMGSGIAGFCFSQSFQSNTLTFGDGTNGFIPPSGARIRFPMVHVATSTVGSIASGTSVMSSAKDNRYEIETVNGGDIELSGVSLGSAQFEDSLAGSFDASYCASNTAFGGYACLKKVTYSHCIFVADPLFDTRSTLAAFPAIVDLVNGAEITDCLSISMNDSGETTNLGGITSLDLVYARNIHIGNGDLCEFEFNSCSGVVADDLVIIGTQLICVSASNVTIKNLKTQRSILGGIATAIASVQVTTGSQNFKLEGWEILKDSAPTVEKFRGIDVSKIKIRGFHFSSRAFDNARLGGAEGGNFALVTGLSDDLEFARCYQTNGTGVFATLTAGTTRNVKILNCSASDTAQLVANGINSSIRGLRSASGNTNSSSGIDVDYPGTLGSNTGDFFYSDTNAHLYCLQCPGSATYPILISAGSPKFTKDGDVDAIVGDQWIVEMPYFARGHTAFTGTVTSSISTGNNSFGTDEWSQVDVEIQYNIGDGWNGTWIDTRVPSNLTAITVPPSGIKLKYRFTCNTDFANGNLFMLETTTSLAAQSANLHPIDKVDIAASGHIAGTRVQLYNVTQDIEMDSRITIDSSFVYEATPSEISEGDLIRLRATYASGTTYKEPIELFAIADLTNGNTFFISQVDWAEVANLGIDGSTCTEFTADYPNIQIDANDLDGVSSQKRIVAWYAYTITTAEGVANFFGAIKVEDIANARIEVNKVNLKLQNVSSVPLLLNDPDYRLYTSDSSNPVAITGNNAAIVWQTGKIYIGSGGGAVLSPVSVYIRAN